MAVMTAAVPSVAAQPQVIPARERVSAGAFTSDSDQKLTLDPHGAVDLGQDVRWWTA
jgi:hypothetical protein